MMGPKRRGVQQDRDLIAPFCSEVCKSWHSERQLLDRPKEHCRARTEVGGLHDQLGKGRGRTEHHK